MNLQDPMKHPAMLTPIDLYLAGIDIEEAAPNYYRYRCIDDGKVGAMHDTPQQAIQHARKTFKVWEDE